MYSLPSQPQGIGKTLDSGIKLYLAGFKKVFPIALAASILGVLPNLLGFGAAGVDPASVGAMLGVVFLIVIIGSIILYSALTYRLGAVAAQHDVSFGDAIKRGVKTFFPVLVAYILYALAMMIGMVLLVIPGMILMITLSFFFIGIVLDDEGIIASLKNSHRVAWGNWWRIVIIYTIPMLVVMGLYMGMMLGISFAAAFGGAAMGESIMILMILGMAAISALVNPLFYSVMIAVYHDLKLRKDGGDIEARMEG